MAGKVAIEVDAAEEGLTDLHVEEAAPQHEFSKPWKNSDVVLVVEDQNLHVHRFIVEMTSPVLQKMLSEGSEGTQKNEISLPDKKANEFVDFLREIYPQFTNTLTVDNVGYIYALAEEFQVKNVLESCKMFVSSQNVTKENLPKILFLAQRCKVNIARQRCCQELQKFNTLQELETFLPFENMDEQTLRDVVVPRAKRLEKCMQQVPPTLFRFIDLAVNLSSKIPDGVKPKLCPAHYDVNSVCAKDCGTAQQRLKCEACLNVVNQLQLKKCKIYKDNKAYSRKDMFGRIISDDHKCYTSVENPSGSIKNTFQAIINL